MSLARLGSRVLALPVFSAECADSMANSASTSRCRAAESPGREAVWRCLCLEPLSSLMEPVEVLARILCLSGREDAKTTRSAEFLFDATSLCRCESSMSSRAMDSTVSVRPSESCNLSVSVCLHFRAVFCVVVDVEQWHVEGKSSKFDRRRILRLEDDCAVVSWRFQVYCEVNEFVRTSLCDASRGCLLQTC